MPFQKGNQLAANGSRWRNAIDKALESRSKAEGQQDLVALAEVMLLAAENGDAWALKELGDRLDGKAPQALNIGDPNGNPLELIGKVTLIKSNEPS